MDGLCLLFRMMRTGCLCLYSIECSTALGVLRLRGLLPGLDEPRQGGGGRRHDGEELLECLPVSWTETSNDRSSSAGHRHGQAERQRGD